MFELINKNGVFLLKSTVLKSKHAFSTRIGGVSSMEHTKSLNLAYGRGDSDALYIITHIKCIFAYLCTMFYYYINSLNIFSKKY